MAVIKTLITEIVTGLGTAGLESSLPALLANPKPSVLEYVEDTDWNRIQEAFMENKHLELFETAFGNGKYFLQAREGLGGRCPYRVEWKGSHRTRGDESIPADIRINWVFLISCKYESRILHNVSPVRLFNNLLRADTTRAKSWYSIIAPEEYQSFYASVRHYLLGRGIRLPACISELSTSDRETIKNETARNLPCELQEDYNHFCRVVSCKTARCWQQRLGRSQGRKEKELLFYRLIRLCSCPYFILGSHGQQPIRLRVDSPWEWTRHFLFENLEIEPICARQPKVDWRLTYRECGSDLARDISGYVEIRWSHGRFNGNPEAKVCLYKDLENVPGYNLL